MITIRSVYRSAVQSAALRLAGANAVFALGTVQIDIEPERSALPVREVAL